MSMLFINTRPLSAKAICFDKENHRNGLNGLGSFNHSDKNPNIKRSDIEHLDIKVRHLPLLHIQPQPIDEKSTAYQQALLDGRYQLLVVISIQAARLGLKALGARIHTLKALIDQGKLGVVAVGKATLKVLTKAGLSAICPDERLANNEGMLALAVVQRLTPADRVLMWAGVDGRTLFADTLRKKGIGVDKIAFYERQKPPTLEQDAPSILTGLENFARVFVLITSQKAWEYWQLVRPHQELHYIVMGERLANLVRAQTNQVCVIYDLSVSTLMQCLAEYEDESSAKKSH